MNQTEALIERVVLDMAMSAYFYAASEVFITSHFARVFTKGLDNNTLKVYATPITDKYIKPAIAVSIIQDNRYIKETDFDTGIGGTSVGDGFLPGVSLEEFYQDVKQMGYGLIQTGKFDKESIIVTDRFLTYYDNMDAITL